MSAQKINSKSAEYEKWRKGEGLEDELEEELRDELWRRKKADKCVYYIHAVIDMGD